jgi:hypothetical protein
VVVHERGVGRHGLDRVEDGRERFVLDVDLVRRGARLALGGRGDGRDHVPYVPRWVGEDALVLHLAAVGAAVLNIGIEEGDGAGRYSRNVDVDDAGVRVRRANERGVEHARALDVDGVALLACHAGIADRVSSW